MNFGNIKCKICGANINPIKMHDHLLVCKLQAKVERYEKALEFYADEQNYFKNFAQNSYIEKDIGKIAREVLEVK